MIRKQLVFLITLSVAVCTLGYTQPKMVVVGATHDFGRIEEANGPVAHEFNFKNEGDAPLVIAGVKASCGCTTPFWTKEPVMPGEEGKIEAKFDPTNRPGGFSKSLSVTSNSEPNVTMLFIKGYVSLAPKSPEEEYTKKMGDIWMKSNYLTMGKMYENDSVVSKSFKIYNGSDTIITFSDMMAVPKFIGIEIVPMALKPKEIGVINVNYYPMVRNDLGLQNDMITLVTDEKNPNGQKYLNITGQIQMYFPEMTEDELAKAPKIRYTKESHDFGNISQGEKVTYKFSFTNTGKEELVLRKVKSTCGCTAALPDKTSIAPGEESYIEVTFDSNNRKGKQYKYVTVFSNDPSKPESRLDIRSNVVVQEN